MSKGCCDVWPFFMSSIDCPLKVEDVGCTSILEGADDAAVDRIVSGLVFGAGGMLE